MSDLMKKIYNACDPRHPATPEYYTDCIDGRGESALTRDFLGQLALANDYISYLHPERLRLCRRTAHPAGSRI